MEDIAPKLYEKIKKEFDRKISDSKKLNALSEKLAKGTATYKEAHEFAIESGGILSQVFQNNISSSVLPDGRLYYNIADRIIRPMMGDLYEGVADYSKEVQTLLNKQHKIGIKAIKPELNEDKVQGIVDITSGKERFDDIAYMLGDPLINFAQTIVDDAVRANADFQYKAGLSPKIIRTSTGKCCKWCDNLAGVYEYEEVSDTGNDVFRRHKHCKCLVEYEGSDGKRTNVHTKKTENKADIEKRIETANKEKKGAVRSREYYIEKSKEISSNDLEGMNLKELRKVATEVGVEYYKQGLSGVNFGGRDPETVVRKLVAQGNRTSLKKDIVSMRKKLRDSQKNDTIKPDKIIKGHEGTPKKAEAGTVIDHIGKDGKVDVRAFYGESNLKSKDIHTTAHGNPKQHPYGAHGEHVHDYTWGDNEKLKNKTTRELSEEERKENRDIL